MKRNEFLRITGLKDDNLKAYCRRGLMPFVQARVGDYSLNEAFCMVVTLWLVENMQISKAVDVVRRNWPTILDEMKRRDKGDLWLSVVVSDQGQSESVGSLAAVDNALTKRHSALFTVNVSEAYCMVDKQTHTIKRRRERRPMGEATVSIG